MYKIGKTIFDIKLPKDFEKIARLERFKYDVIESDVSFELNFIDELPKIDESKCNYASQQLVIEKHEDFTRYFQSLGSSYAIVDEYKKNYQIYMQNHSFDSFPFFIPSLLCLERVLIEKETFVFHSSNINFKNQSILFTGNSGGGKSTQADLWAKYKDAEILNGDRNILGKEENQWFTYGTPFSGSSPYCVNKKNPLDAIIILEKGPINQIRRLDIQGFNQIFSQVTVNPWDKEFCNKIMDLIIQLCNEIPIYVYSCTKDESAVNYLYETLVKDGVIHDNNE